MSYSAPSHSPLSPLSPLSPHSQQRHCIVVGGGFAGAAAAFGLVEAGWRVTLVEAKTTLGGRVYSLLDRETGEAIDNGQHLLMGCYESTLALLNALGTASMLRPQAAMRVDFIDMIGAHDRNDANEMPDARASQRKSQHKSQRQSPRIHCLDASMFSELLSGNAGNKIGMALGLMRLGGLTLTERLQALVFMAALQTGAISNRADRARRARATDFSPHSAAPKPRQTALQLLRTWRQSDALITRLWEPIILATLNAQPAEADAALLVEVLQRAFFGSREASRLLLPRRELDTLLAPLSAWLEARGSAVRTGMVKSFLLEDFLESQDKNQGENQGENQRENTAQHQSVCGVQLADGTELRADAVVSAVPPFALKKIIQQTLTQTLAQTLTQTLTQTLAQTSAQTPARAEKNNHALERLQSGLEAFSFSPIVSVYLWFDRDFVPFDFAAMLGTTTQWIFNRRRLCDYPPAHAAPQAQQNASGGHLSLTVSASDDIIGASNDAIVERCMSEIRRAFAAEFDAAHPSPVQLLHARVVKEKLATPRITPALEPLRPNADVGVAGLVLAGDWTNTGLPATIESAAQSGLQAASVLASRQVSRQALR
jgi:hydroxysqualene dehydroxylase